MKDNEGPQISIFIDCSTNATLKQEYAALNFVSDCGMHKPNSQFPLDLNKIK